MSQSSVPFEVSIPGSTSLKYRLRDTEHENPDTARKHSETIQWCAHYIKHHLVVRA